MATAARPQTSVAPVAPASAMVLYNKPELATFTSPEGKALISAKLTPGVTLDTVLAELWFAIQKNPEIAKCTPDSQLMAVDRALSWGLAIGDKAHLVPFSTKNGKILTAVRDYKGDIELVYRATGVLIDAHVFWDDDKFDYELGDSPFVKHRPPLKRKEGAKIIGAYAIAPMGRGQAPKIVIMGVDEIEAIRKTKSKSWYEEWHPTIKGKKQVIPIEKIPWYCEKSAVHKMTKQLPTTPTNQVALQKIATQLEEEIITDAIIEDAPDSPSAGQVANPERDGRTPAAEPAGAVEHDISDMVEEGQTTDEQPTCPVCAGPMIDRRLTKQNLQSPDFVCQDAVCAREKKGVYWPGEWPPKPAATDEQRAEIGRLTAELAKLGGNTRSINSANAKNADPAFKTHHADALIRKLAGFVAEAAKAKPAATSGDYNTKDSSVDTVGKF